MSTLKVIGVIKKQPASGEWEMKKHETIVVLNESEFLYIFADSNGALYTGQDKDGLGAKLIGVGFTND